MSTKLAVMVLAVVAMLEAQDFRGGLIGTVTDSSGARVPSASMVLQATGSGTQRTTTADSKGEYRLSDLAPGVYRMIVNAPGFTSAESDVTVRVSSMSLWRLPRQRLPSMFGLRDRPSHLSR
jgi:hypothetical protein